MKKCTKRKSLSSSRTIDFQNDYGTKYQRKTKNGEFQITPIGRLINVKRLDYTTDKEYEELKTIIKKHYKNNWKVKDVFICGYGTIMIDCRN